MDVSRSMRRKANRILVAIGVVVAGVACGDSTGPQSPTSGQYNLSQLNGTLVPMRYLIYGFGAQSYRHILSGSIKFIGGGRLVDVRRVTDQPQGTEPFEFEYRDTASYVVEGDLLIIDRPGIQGQLPPYSDTAFVDGDVLIMPVRTVEGEVPLVRTLTFVRPQ